MNANIGWSRFMSKWFVIQTICPEMYSAVCANTHHDATTFEVDDMIWNIKN